LKKRKQPADWQAVISLPTPSSFLTVLRTVEELKEKQLPGLFRVA